MSNQWGDGQEDFSNVPPQPAPKNWVSPEWLKSEGEGKRSIWDSGIGRFTQAVFLTALALLGVLFVLLIIIVFIGFVFGVVSGIAG